MRRLFWIVMGITVGVLVYRKLEQTAASLAPNQLAQRAGRGATSVGDTIKSFFADVKAIAAVREAELREGVGLDGGSLEPTPREP